MVLLNTANKVYLGSKAATRVYAGATKVWGVAPPAIAPTSWLVTSYTPGADRSDVGGEIGMRLGIGPANLVVTWMGMRCHTGNSGPRTLKLAEFFADAQKATVTVDLTGKTAGQWVWATIAPVTLLANGYYTLMMVTTGPGMQPWNDASPIAMKSPEIANVYYCSRSGGSVATGSPNMSFGGAFDLGWN